MANEEESLYQFSPPHESSNMQLSKNNSTCTYLKSWSSEIALVDGVVLKKGSRIRFKSYKLNYIGCLSLGLGIRNVIAANSYQLKNLRQIGHGCFILSYNGWSFSHSNKEHNDVGTDFQYGVGDVIVVETDEDKLWFKNETRKCQSMMRIQLTEDEWQQACFCVIMYNTGDSVTIQNQQYNSQASSCQIQ